jgi:hypothetical protein
VRTLLATAAVLAAAVIGPAGPADAAAVHRCPAYESLIAQAGLPASFSGVMWRESRCRARATHVNRNGTVDRGLLQINSVHLRRGGAAAGLPPGALYNPVVNVEVAARLYRRAGWRPWS